MIYMEEKEEDFRTVLCLPASLPAFHVSWIGIRKR